MASNVRKARNSLNRAQARKLEDYILKVWNEIQAEHMDTTRIIKMSQVALGFDLCPSNIKSAANALNLELPCRRAFGGKMGNIPKQAIAEALALVADISGELGRTVPPILREFAERHREAQKNAT